MMRKFTGISDGNLAIAPMCDCPQDVEAVAGWLSDPRVLEFYEGRDRPHNVEMVRSGFIRRTEEKGETPCLVRLDGRPVGYIQFYPVVGDELGEYGFPAEARVYGIDQFIGEPDLWGQGLGRRMIRLMLRHLFDVERAEQVVLDPVVENERAIRCYEACGFRKTLLLPEHELHEGRLRDCWLMAATPLSAALE